MTSWPILVTDMLTCKKCGGRVGDGVEFNWGWSGAQHEYTIGDIIDWITSDDGSVVPSYIAKPNGHYNFGDAKIGTIVVLDAMEAACSPPVASRLTCRKCSAAIDTFGVLITNNKIVDAKVFMKGELDFLRSHPNEVLEYIEILGQQWISRTDLRDRDVDMSAAL